MQYDLATKLLGKTFKEEILQNKVAYQFANMNMPSGGFSNHKKTE